MTKRAISPKVTVYITAHNYGKYIKQAVNSVLRQKFSDWELIIINDGSTDNTKNILKPFIGNEKIKIIHQEKRGLAVSNNIALRLSSGKYIMRLDADDYLDENALLVLSNILDTHQNVGLVYADYYRIDQKGRVIDIERRKKIGKEVFLLDLPAHGACTMIRKSCLLEVGGYNEDFSCQDGYDLWIKFVNKYRSYNVNIPLFYYRQHEASLSRNKSRILATRGMIKRNFVERKFGKNMPKVLAIIPVRKQSNVCAGFALKNLAGKPLIDYTINEALKSKLLDKIVVTSDDKDILSHARKFAKVITITRPREMAMPNSRIEPTVDFVLKSLKRKSGYQPEAAMLLYIHSPLRKYKHIDKAIDTMLIFNADSVVSVCEDYNFAYQHAKNGLTPLFKKRLLRLERNSLYKENGAVYLSKINTIKKDSFLGKRLGHIVMLPQESVKIEHEFDSWLADKIIREWKENF
ncbi:MAG: hypothetical protein COV72_02000 [Candidatus Omnitrophica bacterium CG11_big_fil_rev_8_21_14_0_20_42_13]|uniref:Glycosyltransferase 2-like domain-containing protein n=1 Tax=Candidatus Ghiorseimicrobium undicola TaxID=1974746 RepID=A0A2H0LYZ9_9BACT|nr:MAG: hypothetical protein COV72_02000 [Candidatus Omnitrophica bacterium CG11_big_fil_rev_8_21_14_0_20_42_13]